MKYKKILTNNIRIIYKNNNKKHLEIHEAMSMKKTHIKDKVTFNTGGGVLVV